MIQETSRKTDKTCWTKGNRKTCLFCGGEHAFKKEKCLAWGTECLNCGGCNHFAKVCRKSKKAQRSDASVKQIETEEASDSDFSYADFITSITTTISAVNFGSSSTSGYAKAIYSVMEIREHSKLTAERR